VKPARRRRRPLRAKLKAASLVLLVLFGLCAYGAYRLAEWPGFHVQRVRISGNHRVTPAQITAAAAIPTDRNLWLVPLAPARRRIESIPWVLHAHLTRIPPATLRIDVTERTPAAVMALPAGGEGTSPFVLVDATGHALEQSDRPSWPYPLIRGLTPKSADFPRIVADLETLAENGVKVRELDLTALGELVAVTYTRLRLDLGDDSDLARKASLVNPIIVRLGPRVSSVAALDLRAPRTPVVVYR